MFNFILPKLIFKVEKWKWNNEYRIYVSNMGHFLDEHKKRLPISVTDSGYCRVKTSLGYKIAHRLVMLTWKPIPDAENLTVDHLDHNKRNNTINNLEWVTKEENLSRARRDFLTIPKKIVPVQTKMSTFIHCKKHNFRSMQAAAAWVLTMKKEKMTPENIETTVSHIANAIKDNKLYEGRKWKRIKIQEVIVKEESLND